MCFSAACVATNTPRTLMSIRRSSSSSVVSSNLLEAGGNLLQSYTSYLQQHRRSFGSRPIRVLTSGNHSVGHLERKPPDTPEHLKYEQETTLAQARWLALSSNSKQIFARNSSEYIQFDEPETVINAIREVYDQTKTH